MKINADPVMQVMATVASGKPQYELIISRENQAYFCAGCPGPDRLVGHADNGAAFYIFEHPNREMPDSFRPLPEGEGYYAYMGVPISRVNVTADGDIAEKVMKELEQAINRIGMIPIEERTGLGRIDLGSVMMKAEA